MQEATLLRAVEAVRLKITTADEKATGWLAERDRRRRQLAAFLRGIVRLKGSQRQAAAATGIHYSTVSRILDAEGHAKVRRQMAQTRAVATNQNVATPAGDDNEAAAVKTNVVELRRKRLDWKPRKPQKREIMKWFDQFLGWDRVSQKTAKQLVLNGSHHLPETAYYDDNRPTVNTGADADRHSAVGP